MHVAYSLEEDTIKPYIVILLHIADSACYQETHLARTGIAVARKVATRHSINVFAKQCIIVHTSTY